MNSIHTNTRLPSWLAHLMMALLFTLILTGCVRNEDAVGSSDTPPTETPAPGDGDTPSDPPPGDSPADPPPADPSPDDPPADDPPANLDFQAFSLNLHPVLVDAANQCAGCHGATQAPMFANADAQSAYDVVVVNTLVDLAAPATSMIYVRAAIDRHNCGNDASCDQIAANLLAGIQGWAGDMTNPPADPPMDPPEDEMPPPVDPDPPMDPPPMTDVMVFETTLYPLLRDQANFCVNCHGVAQIPTFAVEDVMSAYNVLISQQKVDLDIPANSRIYLRAAEDRHNCGGEASCDQIAATFLAGIQAWADQRVVDPPAAEAIKSGVTNFAESEEAAASRADDALIAFFAFDEGAGTIATDTSGVGAPIVLDLEGMEWQPGGGVRNVNGKAQASLADSQKLFTRITATGQFTVEAWVTADNNDQDGPARIVSYSLNTQQRNFTMGQNALYYVLRNDSTGTGDNGTPQLEALGREVSTALQHVVMSFDPVNGRRIYVDGELFAEDDQGATLEWNDQQILVLGNEVTNNRLWAGVFHMVAVHERALNPVEVQQNFDAGLGNIRSLRFDLTAEFGLDAYIEMLFQPIGGNAYLFAEPRFGGSVSGITIRNVRIAVNDSIPVAAQTFRRVDVEGAGPGTLLSPQGAVIPMADGIDQDQFHLEFEVLGARQGLAEPISPALPPQPLADVPEPVIGVRSFSQLNDSMASVTGVDPENNAIEALYDEIQGQLPATNDVLSFGPSHQVAIQRLATGYCDEVVSNAGSCADMFGTCAIDQAGKGAVSDQLYNRFIGVNLDSQPAQDTVRTEIVSLIDDLGCANGCTGAEAQTVLTAACAAVLSTSALTVN